MLVLRIAMDESYHSLCTRMFLSLHLRVLGVHSVAPTRSSEDNRPDSVTFMLLGAIVKLVVSRFLRSVDQVKGTRIAYLYTSDLAAKCFLNAYPGVRGHDRQGLQLP